VAALVYERRKHAINVFVWPEPSGKATFEGEASRPPGKLRVAFTTETNVPVHPEIAACVERAASICEEAGHRVEASPSSLQALKQIPMSRPDCVITDIMMPHEDGNSLVRQMNVRDWEGGAAPPVLALTACGNPKGDNGFAECLSKPIDPLVLAQAVRRAVVR